MYSFGILSYVFQCYKINRTQTTSSISTSLNLSGASPPAPSFTLQAKKESVGKKKHMLTETKVSKCGCTREGIYCHIQQ